MNIYEKINKIMADVVSLQKDGKCAFGSTNYKFLSEAKTTEIFREQLVKHKLVLLPVNVQETREGKVTHGMYTYQLINVEKPEEKIQLMASGQGHDSADKGSGKSSSYAYKYLLWRMFAIPSNDDPDQISNDEINDKLEKERLKKEAEALKPITAAKVKTLDGLITSTASDKSKLLTYYKVEKLEDITNGTYAKVLKVLQGKVKSE